MRHGDLRNAPRVCTSPVHGVAGAILHRATQAAQLAEVKNGRDSASGPKLEHHLDAEIVTRGCCALRSGHKKTLFRSKDKPEDFPQSGLTTLRVCRTYTCGDTCIFAAFVMGCSAAPLNSWFRGIWRPVQGSRSHVDKDVQTR
eukprot:1829947-Amphidinium_carterae.1